MKSGLACITLGATALLFQPPHAPGAEAYPIVGTGQTRCYDDRQEIDPPKKDAPFYGQDAQFPGRTPSYTLSADGLTVQDNVTGLTWQRSPDWRGNGPPGAPDKLTFAQARALPAALNAAPFAGFNDWRLPTIKELYSLIEFSGVDVSGPNLADASRQKPFIDTRFFKFAYGDARAGERIIDSQWASGTVYAANPNQVFGVNFADGRIKGYGATMPGGRDKTFFVLCVRGNPAYGQNDFHDNHDGTITDRATGLMWSKADSGKGMNWEAALAWVQQKNGEKYLGHGDWRLPNVKELQSIVDYSRAPATTHSAAIDPVFDCTPITNALGQTDYAYYWSGTTHAGMRGGDAAAYVAFGRASGWMPPRGPGGGGGGGRMGPPPELGAASGPYRYEDVHGAGAQRSDPKTGDPALFPHGRGPQGDVIRIDNFVRLVR
jgi:hypothetical protein